MLVDKARNGVFKPTLMIDGKTVGTWSAKQKKDSCEIIISPFEKLNISEEELEDTLTRYKEYLGKEIKINML
jgi:hypothetical protein